MNIIYVANTCSSKKYTEYIESKGARISQQAQKYNLLLAEGLSTAGAKVKLISSRPINRNVTKKLWFKSHCIYIFGNQRVYFLILFVFIFFSIMVY